MVKSENKKFLWPKGSRLWPVYRRDNGEVSVWRSNAHIVKGWVPCSVDDRERINWNWTTNINTSSENECVYKCKSGAMRAVFADGHLCVCKPDSSEFYVDEKQLREYVEAGNIKNHKMEWRRGRSGPKVWDGYKEYRRQADARN